MTQPIVIKQSSKPGEMSKKLNTTKDSEHRSRITGKPPSLSTIRKPQLTNYALN